MKKSLAYSEENWNGVLESLGFSEIKNPNGFECYDVLNDNGIPSFQYSGIEEKKQLYMFFQGAVYWKMHSMFN